jgi:hypothetical protein
VGQFFASKLGSDFFKRGIKKLPEWWRTVVSKNGDYLTDWLYFTYFWLFLTYNKKGTFFSGQPIYPSNRRSLWLTPAPACIMMLHRASYTSLLAPRCLHCHWIVVCPCLRKLAFPSCAIVTAHVNHNNNPKFTQYLHTLIPLIVNNMYVYLTLNCFFNHFTCATYFFYWAFFLGVLYSHYSWKILYLFIEYFLTIMLFVYWTFCLIRLCYLCFFST